MIALKAVDVKTNFKDVCARAFAGETILISRPKNQNVVLLSESEYNNILNNLAYLAKLEKSVAETKQGHAVSKTLEELRAME